MNPLELEERENKEGYDSVFKCLDKTLRGEKVEIKDLVPELKEISNKSYSLFTHPGDPETATKFLAKTWPFTRYGLPFVLWDCDIEKANMDKYRA